MHSSLSGLVQSFLSLQERETEFVLATITETAGSTYRKPGARMLITRDGELCGLLSGGCLEADLYEHAKKVFDEQTDTSIYYDMRSSEDLIWGLGLGCDGAVRIRLEYLSPDNDYAPLSLIRRALESASPAVVMTIIDSEHESLPEGSHYLYPGPDAGLPQELTAAARSSLEAGRSALQTLTIDGGSVGVFFGLTMPPPRLLIIGAGPDAVPVTDAARLLGWDITVVDYREAFIEAGKFPAADRVIHSTPEALGESVDSGHIDAAVLMTHKLEYDQRYLARLARSDIRYIGLLGPAARREELLKYLGDERRRVEDRVYGPVGLDIGAQLPEEIAFSLVAEIQAVLRNRRGGFLSLKTNGGRRNTEKTGTGREHLYGIVLAAGGSTRFGGLKQLLEFNGKSLLRHAADLAHAAVGDRVIVVHGPKATKCQREIAGLSVTNIVNEEWQSGGMAMSLKTALDRLPDDCRGVMVLLCDQPLIEDHHIERMIEAWLNEPERIVAGEYDGTFGVPAIFPRRYFKQLRSLYGDKGAKSLLLSNAADVTGIPLEEAAVDIDTQADYEALLRRQLLSG